MRKHVRQGVWSGWAGALLAIAGCAESRLSAADESATLRDCDGVGCMADAEVADNASDAGSVPDVLPEPPSVVPEPPSVVEPSLPPPSFASYQSALASCGLVRETAYRGEDHEDMQALMVRDWFMCERGAWWHEDEVGIRIEPNGKWTLLLLEGDSIVLARDVSQKGDYTWGDNGTGSGGTPAILMDLASNPGDNSWNVYTPTFSDDPFRMFEWPHMSDHELELISAQ